MRKRSPISLGVTCKVKASKKMSRRLQSGGARPPSRETCIHNTIWDFAIETALESRKTSMKRSTGSEKQLKTAMRMPRKKSPSLMQS